MSLSAPTRMKTARWLVVIIGLALPRLVRLPGGEAWVLKYDSLIFDIVNAAGWGGLLAVSWLFRRAEAFAVPALAMLCLIGWFHAEYDPTAGSTAILTLFALPIVASIVLVLGTPLGLALQWGLDRLAARRGG